jgi:dihydroorotase
VKLLIKNGRVIDPRSNLDDTLDILIDKGRIVDIKTKIRSDGAKEIDASRLVVAPGLIDMHVHLREPGYEYKETIKTGGSAAAAGGFTTIACMPNTKPVNDSRGVTKFIISQAKRDSPVNILPIAAITKASEGEVLTDMADLLEAGAAAFSDDGRPLMSSQTMRRALEYSKIFDSLIIDHCEDLTLTGPGVMNEGPNSYLFGLKGIPSTSEEVMVARDCILAGKAGSRIHIAHVSTRGTIEILDWAKSRDIRVTAEVTPHHLLLDDSAIKTFDTNLKMSPPLRSEDDVKALTAAVKSGLIDVFATDHAPHSPDEKDVEFDQAPNGIIGLETAVPLLLDRLVNRKIISLNQFVAMFSTKPAELLGLKNKGCIAVGADADLTLLNLHKSATVRASRFRSQGRNCPFNGWKLKGIPAYTIVGGKVVHAEE